MKINLARSTHSWARIFPLILGVIVVVFGVPAAAWAAETLVNTETNNDQNYPAIARDPDGNYVITWHSDLQDGSSFGVYGQQFDAAGSPQGAEFLVNTTTAFQQGNSSVAMDDNGNFVVVWQSERQDAGLTWGIYGQRYLANGTTDGSEFQINTTSSGDQAVPCVAMDSAGNFVVAWQGYGATDSYGIHARRYNSTGTPLAAESLVHEITANNESAPSIAMDPDGNYVITWERDSSDGSGKGVYARRFNNSGVAQGTDFLVNTTTTNDQEEPNVAMDLDGDFVIVWESLGTDGSLEGIYAQRYNAAGTTQGSEFQVNTTTASDQQNPNIGMDPGGNFFITWESDGQDGSGMGIYGREYNYLGTALTGEFAVNTTSTGTQTNGHNSIVGDSEGNWVFAWYGNGTGDAIGVFFDTFASTVFADLQLVKTVDEASPIEGATIVYTLTLNNLGPNNATTITIEDALPAGVTYVSNTPSQGSYNDGTGIWTVGDVANAASVTLDITCTVDAGTGDTTIDNTASVASVIQADSVTNNNTDTVSITVQSADLQLAKSVDNATPNEGGTIVYTVTLDNLGPYNATGITVTDALPAGVTFVSSTPSQGSYNDGTNIWTVGNVANAASVTLDITCTVDAGTGGSTIDNTASISASAPMDPVAGNNSDTISITVQSANLQLVKTVDDSSPNEGGTVVYTVTLNNLGPNDATGITVTDALPAGVTFVSSTPSLGSYNDGTNIWTVGNVANAASVTLDITCTVDAGTGGSTIDNTATISAVDQADAVAGNNSDTISITVQAVDLQLVKTVDDATPNEGGTVVYTLTLNNLGPNDATGITVTDALPAGVTFVSGTPSQGSYNDGTNIWTVGNVANAATVTLDISCTVDAGTGGSTIDNTATISAVDQADAVAGNNSDTISITVQAVDLQLVKTVDDATPNEGGTVVYTLTLNNLGPNDATGITVTDALPAGVTFVSSTPSQGTYDNGTNIWTVGNVVNAASVSLDINCTVDAGTGGSTIDNTASISAVDQADAVAGNNSDTISITVQAVDLQLVKTVDDATPNEGGTVVYTLTLNNLGPNDATGITVTDALPAGVTFVSSTPSQGSYNDGTNIWTVGNVANAATATLDITCTVDAGTGGSTIDNTAAISAADQADAVAGNNSDTISITVQAVDLQLVKTVDDATPNEGGTVVYTLTLNNLGPNDATGITVTDALPAGVTFVSSTPSQGSYNDGTNIWTVGNVANAATATLDITCTVDAGTGGSTIDNTAAISAADQADAVAGNNSDTISITVQAVDLQLVKTVDDATPNEGGTVVYTLTLNNLGPNDATGITVTDALPAGVTFVSSTPSQGSYNDGTNVWTVGNVSNAASMTLDITCTVDAGTGGSTIDNTATISAVDQADAVAGNNSDTISISVQAVDLQLVKTVDDATPIESGTIVYTITLNNLGPDTATAIAVADTLPSGMTFVSSIASQGDYAAATGIWTVGNIANTGNATLDITCTVDAGTSGSTIDNTATITAVNQADAVPANNTDTISITVQAIDLQLVKTVDDATPNEGGTIVYTLTLNNLGPNDATGIAVTDALPAGVTFTSSAPSQGVFDEATGIWTAGNIANAGSATLDIACTIDAGAGGTAIINTALVSAVDQTDATPGNNTDTATVTIPFSRGSIQLTNLPVDFDSLEPGEAEKPILKFQLVNLTVKADTLHTLELTNSSFGSGDAQQLDENWENLSLWIENGSILEDPAATRPLAITNGTFNAGQLTFSDLGISLLPDQEITLVVQGQASLIGRDGDLLSVSLADTTALTFALPTDIITNWPVTTIVPLVIDGLVADQIVVNGVEPGLFPQDTARNLVLDVIIPPNGYQEDQLQRLNIVNRGDAVYGNDITTLEAWADNGDDNFDPNSDLALGTFAFTGARWELTGLEQTIALSGLRLFISADISADAAEGRTIQMALPTLPDVGIGTASGNDGPRDRFIANPYSQAISTSNRVLMTSWAIEPATVKPGDYDVALLHILASNTYETERTLSYLTVTNGSTGAAAFQSPELDGQLASLTLRLDGDGDGLLGDLTNDPVLGSGYFMDGAIVFSGLDWTLAPAETRHLFLTGDVAMFAARDGDILSANIATGSDLGFSTSTAVSASWPLDSGAAWTVDGMVASQIINYPVPNRTLTANEGPTLVMDLTIPRNGYEDDTLMGLTLMNQGTATETDLAELKLWRDGGDGLFTPGSGDDTELAPLVPVAGVWSSPVLNETIYDDSLRLFVGLTVAATPTNSATVELAIPVNGITLTSDNSGPNDQTISAQSIFLLSTVPLLTNLEFDSSQSTVNQSVTVRMILRNTGGDNLINISPETPVAIGDGVMSLASGPMPASLDLASGAVDTFTWVYTASTSGDLILSSSAEGVTENTAQVRTSLTSSTSEHQIFTPVALLEVFSVTNMPFTLNRGQDNVVPLTLTFLLPELENSSTAHMTSLRLHLVNSDGQGIIPADLLDQITVSEGVNIFLEKNDMETVGDEIALNFPSPIVVRSGEPVSVALSLDISDQTEIPNFRVSIEDPSWFTVYDAVSGDLVPAVLQGSAFPIQSVVGTIVFEATGLEISNRSLVDSSVGISQNDTPLLSLELFNPGQAGLGSTIVLNALSFSLVDTIGNVLPNPDNVLAAVRVYNGDQFLMEAELAASDTSSISLVLPSALTVPANATVALNLRGDIAATSPTGVLMAKLDGPASVTARDGNSGAPVLVSFATADIEGPKLRIEQQATQLMATSTPLLPSTLVIGAQGVTAFSMTLRHGGDADVATIEVDSLRISCHDQNRNLISPVGLIDKLELRANGIQLSVLHDPTGSGIITMALAGFELLPGQTENLELKVDFRSTAQPSSLVLLLEQNDFFARDINLNTPVLLAAESGMEFPLSSGLTRLQSPAEELTVAFEDLMPPVLTGSGIEIPVAKLTFTNPADLETAVVTLESVTLRASDEDLALRPVGAWVEEILLYQDSELWGSVSLAAKTDTFAVITPIHVAEMNPGQILDLDIRIRMRPDANAEGLYLGLTQDDIKLVQPEGIVSAVRIEASEGYFFPFWTDVAKFSTASLADSYSNFPNPFAAGWEATTFVIQLPTDAKVSLKIMTAHWRPVRTILSQEMRAAGLYQEDQWDGKNGLGVTVQNGVYVAELVVEYSNGNRVRHLRKVAVVR